MSNSARPSVSSRIHSSASPARLLAGTGLMVGYDYIRGWKWFQLEFNRIQEERIEQELKAKDDPATRAKLAEFDREMREGQVVIAKKRDAYLEAHGAIVARECGIPAVVGVLGATERISTGQQITVNGSAGTVTFVHE